MNNKTLFFLIAVIGVFYILTRTRKERMTTSEYTSDSDAIDVENTGDDYMTSLSTISLEQSDKVKRKIYNTTMAIRSDTTKLALFPLNDRARELVQEIIDQTDSILIADEYTPEMETVPHEEDGSIYFLANSIRNLGYKLQKVTTDAGIYDMGIVIESNGKQLAKMYENLI
jgi:hypothetical protein